MNNPIGKQLNQQSMTVLKNNKKMLVFPLITSALTLLGIYYALQPLYKLETIAFTHPQSITTAALIYLFIFLILFFSLLNTLTIMSNCALTGYALSVLQGEKPSLPNILKMTVKKTWQAYRWQADGNIIGTVLRILLYWVDGFDQKPSIQKLLQGLPWSVATLLALPILLKNKLSPLQIIAHSAVLTRNTWGTTEMGATKTLQSQLSSNMGLGIIKILLFVLIILTALMHPDKNPAVMSILIASIIGFFTINILTNTLQIITLTAVYLFSQKIVTRHYHDEKLLAQAFKIVPKKALD